MATRLSRLGPAPMQGVVMAILEAHGLTEAFTRSAEFHLKLENAPYMPLVIERQGDEVAVMHYFTQNGDLMRDPEVVFRHGSWEPISITQDPVGIYREVFLFVGGRRVMNARLLRELEDFARLWAANLRAQGFTDPARVTATSLSHPKMLNVKVPT
ncbi:MAG: hypothetical protein IT318_08290 [Anaerolineales bacterium]|nr:hypothetical protein [Anaerolineales bacterium]